MRWRHDPVLTASWRRPSPLAERFAQRLQQRGLGAVALEHYILVVADCGGIQWEHHVYTDLLEHLSADKLAAHEDAIVSAVERMRGK